MFCALNLEHPAGWICAHYKSYYYYNKGKVSIIGKNLERFIYFQETFYSTRDDVSLYKTNGERGMQHLRIWIGLNIQMYMYLFQFAQKPSSNLPVELQRMRGSSMRRKS